MLNNYSYFTGNNHSQAINMTGEEGGGDEFPSFTFSIASHSVREKQWGR